MSELARDVFVTGATGYIGRELLPALLARGHRVHALVRPGRGAGLPSAVKPVEGNALVAEGWPGAIPSGATLVQLVGTPHPAPWKARSFEEVDLASARASLQAARERRVAHFVYLSVAQPAPVMRAYLAARSRAEAEIRASGIPATFLRPWYVLGPGHRWPVALAPVYALAELLPSTREGARRLGLITLAEMTAALVSAVESPPSGVRVLDVPALRALSSATRAPLPIST